MHTECHILITFGTASESCDGQTPVINYLDTLALFKIHALIRRSEGVNNVSRSVTKLELDLRVKTNITLHSQSIIKGRSQITNRLKNNLIIPSNRFPVPVYSAYRPATTMV
jgi:uncharacterized Fe-S cluster protein YjdI